MSNKVRSHRRDPRRDLHLVGRSGALRPVVADAVERASAADRRYFLAHPAEASYLRELVPGEFGEASRAALLAGLGLGAIDGLAGEVMVEVTQIRPGARQRRPAYVLMEAAS